MEENPCMIRKLYWFFILTATINGFIIRLPCNMYAKFNIMSAYYINGNVNMSLPMLARKDCIVSCITNPSCILTNYKKDGTVCELISSVGLGEVNIEWDTYSTNTTSDQRVGQICENVNPCTETEYCRDVCGDDNNHTYVCLETRNAARSGNVTLSSTYSSYVAKYAVDGNYNNFMHTNYGDKNWLKVDIRYVYSAKSVIVYNRVSCCQERLIGYALKAGVYDNEDKCQLLGILSNRTVQTFQYAELVRYVFISKTPGNPYLHIAELEVRV